MPVLIDMQEMALVGSTEEFLAEVALKITRASVQAGIAVNEPEFDAFAASPSRAFNRFLDRLEVALGTRRVVMMFDEFELIEEKIDDGSLDKNLLDYFRSLIQHRGSLLFIFTGTHKLEEMSHNYWSVFFNIALPQRISFLAPADAERLIREPVAGALLLDALAVEKIIELTHGQPYFVQLICWALVSHCNTEKRNYATLNDVNDVVQQILRSRSGEAYFAFIWTGATKAQRLALAGLAHTIGPGKAWARPSEIMDTLTTAGDIETQRSDLVKTLDRLAADELLQVAAAGTLRFRYQIEVLRLWVAATQPMAAVVERES